mgnify:CR=1 FL=1
MSRVALVLSVVGFGVFSTGAAAQTRPDFSGQWTSDPAPTAQAVGGQANTGRGAAGARAGTPGGADRARAGSMRRRVGDMGSGWGSNLTIGQDTNRLTVEYAFFSRGDMQPALVFDYALDGSGTTNSVMIARR